jgi:hypothetical protein
MKENKSEANKQNAPTTVGFGVLLGCPWCGEKPEYYPAGKSAFHPRHTWTQTVVHNCMIVGNISLQTDTLQIEDTKEALFAAWNTRKQPNVPN